MVGGVKEENTKSAARRVGGAAPRCLKRLMWVDPLGSRNERAQKTRQMHAEFLPMDFCDRFTLSGCSFCRFCGVCAAYDDA